MGSPDAHIWIDAQCFPERFNRRGMLAKPHIGLAKTCVGVRVCRIKIDALLESVNRRRVVPLLKGFAPNSETEAYIMDGRLRLPRVGNDGADASIYYRFHVRLFCPESPEKCLACLMCMMFGQLTFFP